MTENQDATPDSLGFDGFQPFTNTYHQDNTQPACPVLGEASGCDPRADGGKCYIGPSRYGDGELCGPNIHGGPIFWQADPSYGIIYEMPEKDFLKGFKYDLSTQHVAETPFLTATGPFAKPPTDGMPGGFSSLSASKMRNGIVWTSMPVGDGQYDFVPGRLAAFDATTLNELWNDNDNVVFAKSVPPTVADGKVIRATNSNLVIVYGVFGSGAGRAPSPQPQFPRLCYSIEEKYANYGGPSGILGLPTSDEIHLPDRAGGRYQNYRGMVFGMASSLVSANGAPGGPMPTCSVPQGRSTAVESSIYWSPRTCAHVVQGQIRDLWLRLGGARSRLGYPIEDETYTPDHRGRRSRFEHDEIWWYPEKGAYVLHVRRPG
jgi:hypothetical protein